MSPTNFIPAIKPPQGQVPNPVDPQSLSEWNTVCVSVCLSITTIAFALRAYVRVYIKRQWILEDYISSLSWIGLVIFCTFMTISVHKNGGVHEWDLSKPEVHTALYWFNATTVQYAPAMLCTKVSVLLFYRRVFSPSRKSLLDVTLRIFIAVLCMFYAATFFVKIFLCLPRARIWDKSIPGTCLDTASVLNTNGVFNLVTDVVILVIPTKAIWNLHLDWRKKIGVLAVFTLGCLAPVFSVIGTIVRIRVSSDPDVTWNQPLIQMWAAAEITTGLICVCAPTLAALAHSRNLKPNLNTINYPSRSNQAYSRGSRPNYGRGSRQIRLTSQDELDMSLFERNDIEMEGNPTRFRMPDVGVITGIEGGLRSPLEKQGFQTGHGVRDEGTGNSKDEEDKIKGSGIMTTVRIEQSYV